MRDPDNRRLGEIVVEQGLITSKQLQEALEEQKITGEKLGEILIRRGLVTKDAFENCLSIQSGIASFDLSSHIIDPELLKLLPEDFARKYKLIPVFVIENVLTVAMADPTYIFIIDEIQRMTKLTVEAVLAQELDIRKAQDQYYGGAGTLAEIVASINKDKLAEGDNSERKLPSSRSLTISSCRRCR
jgi:type IV pilus assembly protein PilB